MRTLTEFNADQQAQAAQRWKLILELSRTKTPTEIGQILGMSRQRVFQLVQKARQYWGEQEGVQPKPNEVAVAPSPDTEYTETP